MQGGLTIEVHGERASYLIVFTIFLTQRAPRVGKNQEMNYTCPAGFV